MRSLSEGVTGPAKQLPSPADFVQPFADIARIIDVNSILDGKWTEKM